MRKLQEGFESLNLQLATGEPPVPLFDHALMLHADAKLKCPDYAQEYY
jgi:hypothetical protein